MRPNHATRRLTALTLILVFGLLLPSALRAQDVAPQLAPNTTKAFFHVPNSQQLSENFKQTQFSDLANDPVVKPFADDLREQLETKFTEVDTRLGVTWNDLTTVSAGEVAVAVVQPGNNPKLHAVMAMADVTDRGPQVAALMQKVANEMKARKAVATRLKIGAVTATKYSIPARKGQFRPTLSYICTANNWLFVADHLEELQAVLARQTGGGASLAQVPSFANIGKRTAVEENASPDVRWFVEPFGYAAILRAANTKPSARRSKNYAEILQQEGFDAIQGIGGCVNFRAGAQQVVHRSHVLTKAGEVQPLLTKSAKILRFPPVGGLQPPDWVPDDVANCLVINTPIREGFKSIPDLFDAIQGPGFWEELDDGLRNVPNGPRLALEQDLIRFLGDKVVLITRPKLPVTPHSEHQVLAVETIDAKQLMANFYPALDRDPTFVEIEPINGVRVWRHTPKDENDRRRRRPPGKRNPFAKAPKQAPKAAAPPKGLAVANGFLLYSNSEEFLVDLLKGGGSPLAKHADMAAVNQYLASLGASEDSIRYFTRLSRSQLVNFNLLKQNKMAESKTLLGQLLNEIFEPDEPGIPRKQQINGAKLPAFDAVEKYLGNGGVYVREKPDGWQVVGSLLRK